MSKLEKLSIGLRTVKDEYPNINRGGCGFSALLIGNELQKRGFKIKYILISDTIEIETTKEGFKLYNSLKESQLNTPMKANDLGFNIVHIMVYYKGLVIDVDGICSWSNSIWNSPYRIISCVPSERIVKKWVTHVVGWNTTFDRRHLPDIKRKIRRIFKQVYET